MLEVKDEGAPLILESPRVTEAASPLDRGTGVVVLSPVRAPHPEGLADWVDVLRAEGRGLPECVVEDDGVWRARRGRPASCTASART